jgi:hypothetical protein
MAFVPKAVLSDTLLDQHAFQYTEQAVVVTTMKLIFKSHDDHCLYDMSAFTSHSILIDWRIR